MSAKSRAVHDLIRHQRDRSLRETGQAHRYLTDAQFHVAVDLVIRAVEETCKVFAEHPAFDDHPDSVEAGVRASVHIIIRGYATAEDLQRHAQQMINIPPRSPDMQTFMDAVDSSLPTRRGGIRYEKPT